MSSRILHDSNEHKGRKEMIRIVLGLIFTSIMIGLSLQSFDARAQEALRQLPPMLRAISDELGVLSESEGQALSKRVADIQQESRVRIIVVIAETTLPESIESYSHRLLAHWRANRPPPEGVEDVVIVFAITDRTLRIAAGMGMAAVVARVSNNKLMLDTGALLRSRKYFSAAALIVERLSQAIRSDSSAGQKRLI
jgi:uncharacterized protein